MRGERPFIYHTPNGREMFQALQKILPALRTGAVNRAVGDGVLQWSAAEQMPLGYDVPSARSAAAIRPPPANPPSKSQQFPAEFCAPIQNVKISPEVVNYADAKIAITGNTVSTTNILSVHSSVKDAANLGSWNGIAMNNNKYNSGAVKVAGFKDMAGAITAHYEALVK